MNIYQGLQILKKNYIFFNESFMTFTKTYAHSHKLINK